VTTSRGTPIARLAPLSGANAVEGHLARLVRAGVVTLDERLALAARVEGFRVVAE